MKRSERIRKLGTKNSCFIRRFFIVDDMEAIDADGYRRTIRSVNKYYGRALKCVMNQIQAEAQEILTSKKKQKSSPALTLWQEE
ncbi:hypothetical protein [Leclercia sp.]|uniref:hypothetical protein n=1 Tax=Leclercia sp. TaxID=1898428 RepID=UPI0028AAEB6F|nr:hypothetical protein [Leclercia sp.]